MAVLSDWESTMEAPDERTAPTADEHKEEERKEGDPPGDIAADLALLKQSHCNASVVLESANGKRDTDDCVYKRGCRAATTRAARAPNPTSTRRRPAPTASSASRT
ncbi:ATPase [Aureococcus anophagefferens]|nr:ATPase [Aureococcus anophagefferens]